MITVKSKLCILFVFFSLISTTSAFSQIFADSSKYLIDSLDLSTLSERDKNLIDSLLTLYTNCENDTCKINAISAIVEESWDDEVWPKYNQWIHDFIKEETTKTTDSSSLIHFRKSYAATLNNKGYYHNSRGEIDQALEYYLQGLEIQQEIGDKTGVAGTFINIGYIYLNQGLIEKALEYYFKSLQIEEETENQKGIALALNGIGYIHYKQNEIEKAVDSYSKSLKIREELNDKYGIATCLNNLGLIHKDQKQWEQALNYFNRGLKIERELEDKSGIAISMGNIGFVYNGMGNHSVALTYFNDALKIMEELDDKNGISLTLNNISTTLISLGKIKEAKTYALRSLTISNELNYPVNIRNAAETLYIIAKKENNFKGALNYYELFVQMRDSVFNKETVTALIHQEYKYKYEKKALTDSLKNAEKEKIAEALLAASEAENEKLQIEAIKQRQQLYFVIIVLLLFVLFAWLMNNRIKIILKQKRIIETQKDRVEQQKKQLNIHLKEIEKKNEHLEYLNEELKQFAHIVSHDLKTPLRGIVQLLKIIEDENPNLLEGEMKESFDMIKERSIKSQQLVDGILEYSQAGLIKASIGKINITPILQSIVKHLNNPEEIDIKIQSDFPVILANPYQIEQIFSNLISNAIKYNHQPKKQGVIEVKCTENSDLLEFKISDNGPGIPSYLLPNIFQLFKKGNHPDHIDSTGIGLSIVKKLINQNGGKIRVESTEGKGTTFIFTWPK
ncbi:MAG: tetratricopeptide repeat-containing sensor histidine kinase [Cyclobacteriaceae bacterium]|nr:tetratricopeptide repeat-containing sensor histidine kinase [Cyclobacteriaceae bacterium]